MTDVYSPDQLPQGSAQFIAYGPEERAADPQGGEEPLTVRAQTYLRYYSGITIKELKDGGEDGDKSDLLTVHFEPKSVGLSKPIKAHMDSDDSTVPLLREAFANGSAIAIAIETQRKKKNSAEKSPISPLVPIHALRGADNPDGSGHHEKMMGPSGANTSNRLVMVNGRPTKHLVSNPLEWSSLVSNKAGDLPPEGWRLFAPGEDWTQYGAAVPSSTPARASGQQGGLGAALDMDALSVLVAQALHTVLDERENPDPGRITGRPNTRKFTEGKPWDVRTSDGRIHLGSYPVTGEYWALRWAHDYLTKAFATEEIPEPSIDVEEAWALSAILMHLSDRVQSEAYAALVEGGQGTPVEPNRTTPSHVEARRWVEWVIEHSHPYPLPDEESESAEDDGQSEEVYAQEQKAWGERVVTEAVEMLARAGRNVGQVFAAKAKVEKERRQAQPPTRKEESGPSQSVVQAMLDTVARSWNSQSVIGNMGAQAKERGYSDLIVSMSAGEGGAPKITYPAVEGETSGSVHSLLTHRWRELGSGQSDGPAPAMPQEQSATETEGATSTSEQTGGNERPAETPQEDPNRGYTPEVAQAIRDIHGSRDLRSVKEVYGSIRSQNLLAASVFVNPRPEGGFDFGPNEAQGYAKRPLSDVLNALRKHFEGQPTALRQKASIDQPAPEADSVPEVDTEAEMKVEANEAPATEEPEVEADAPVGSVEGEDESTLSEDQGEDGTGDSGDSPEKVSPDENETLSVAQDIANRAASEATTTEKVEALIAEAQEKGVYEDRVTLESANGKMASGTLRAWLKTCLKRVRKASDGA